MGLLRGDSGCRWPELSQPATPEVAAMLRARITDRSPPVPKETAMNRINRYLGVVAALGGALVSLAATVPAAFAVPATFPPPDPQTGPVTHTIVLGGMPGWQITLIAAGAALAAAVAAVLLDRAWTARRSGADEPVLAGRRRLPRAD